MPMRATTSEMNMRMRSIGCTLNSPIPRIPFAWANTGSRNLWITPKLPGRPRKPPNVEAMASRTRGPSIDLGLSWMRLHVVSSERVSLPQKVTKIMRKV